MAIVPFEIGVCSWSLQATSIPELVSRCGQVGVNLVQLACGDPHHARWAEGEDFPAAARAAALRYSGTMIGFPGEDYTTPRHIETSGGFGPVERREERLGILRWAIARTVALGLQEITCHGGFIPASDGPARTAFLRTLARAAALAAESGVTLALETGQETAALLRRTLDELRLPNLGVNFDPANMLLYNMGDPIAALDALAPYLRSVHLKDAFPPTEPGAWGTETPLGAGTVNIPRFVRTLKDIGFRGPLMVEREAGDLDARLRDITHAVRFLAERQDD